nr:PREDICTED: uncharacterized protein LOC104151891 [Struthio camelus australis]
MGFASICAGQCHREWVKEEQVPVGIWPEFSWILAYVSMRSCHRVLQDKYGEFSPPAYHSDAPISFWCNWTIQAGSRKHIIIYIQGFMTKEDCNKNEDKILFEGVSSLVEDSVVYACWKKEMHVFATFAEAVHVVLLKTYLPNCRDTQFKGKYYIFHDEEGESSSREDLISETPSKVPKRDHILQSGVMEDLRDVLSFATTASLGSLDKPTAVSTLIPVSHQGLRTELLETNAPYVLGCLWPAAPALCGQDPGRGSSWSASPTATLDTWRPSLSMSGDIAVDFGYIHGFSSVLSETPLLGALEGEEPFLGPAGVGLESRQVSLNPSLQPKDLGDPQFNIKPTHMSDLDLAAPSQALSPSREEGIDPAVYQGLSTVGLEKTKRCPLLSSVADGAASSLAESLMPSLTSQNDLVNGGHSPLLPGRSFFEALSVTEPELRTSVLQHMTFVGFPAPGSFRGVTDEVKKVLHPTASWDILRGQPQLSTQSSHVLQLVPTDPRRVGPCSDHVPCAPSLGVKNCGSLSSTVTQLPLAIPLLPAAWGCAPSTSEPVFSTLGMEMTPMLVCPSLDPASTELGSPDFTLAASLPAEQTAELGMSEPFAVFTANAEAFTALPTWELGGLVEGMEPPVPAAFPLEGLDKAWTSISPSPRQGSDLMGPFVASSSCLGPGVRKLVLDGDGEEGSWRGEVLAPAGWADKGPIPAASAAWQQVLDPQLGMGLPQPEDLVAASLPSAPVSLPSDDPVSQNIRIPAGGERHKHAELGSPWTMEYFPVRSCHIILQGEFGLFYLPLHSDIKTNVWCNWTIWAGPQKHILIYVQGFQASEGCDKNQDKIIFQGVLSDVETKVVYACHNRGTLIFATQATAVHVLLLSGGSSKYKHFKGRYYVFRDYTTVGSSNDAIAPVWEISKTDISSKVRHPHAPKDANGGELSLLEDETELERSLRDGSAEGRGESEDVLVEPPAARGDTGGNTKLPALEITERGVQPEPALVPTAPCSTTDVPLEAPSSSAGPSAAEILPNLAQMRSSLLAGVAAATGRLHAQTVVMEGPPLNASVKPSPLYPSPGMTAEDTVMPGERHEDLFDLASVLASLENDTVLRSQHHPGDVLFEVTIETKHVDWVPRGGSELRKDLLESMKSHIRENLKLSTNRVNEIKLKEIRRVGRDNLLLTFWLHLKPEERNLSLALQSQLQELLGTSVGAERPRLVSLFVEDVNECNLGLCGEEADCFNGVGTYLCRCKKDYEDHSPTKSGTLCIPAPRSGISFFFRHPEVLVGAAVSSVLVLLVAVGILCGVARQRRPTGDPCPEEPGAQSEESSPVAVVMELNHLDDCLRLEPFQLKVRARPPDWISQARASPGQAYGVFIEQDESL